MLSALFYLQAASLKNRLAMRLRRLRQPRYLVGAVVGIGYLLTMFSGSFRHYGKGFGGIASLSDTPEVWELLAGLILLVLALLSWIIPQDRAAMIFTEAEVAFLFPAPVRRSTLIHYKLFKSQFGIFFTVAFLTLLSARPGGAGGAAMRAAGWWIILSTIQLHTIGSSFARTILLERGVAHWQRRMVAVLLAAAVLAGAVMWGAGRVPAPKQSDIENVEAFRGYLQQVAVSAPAVWLLGPFRAVARPFLAHGFPAFCHALLPALGILALHYLWVIRADVAFEEASVEASQRQAARMTEALKTGRRTRNIRPWRKRRDPFPLRSTGAPAVAIFWKNLLAAGQIFSVRAWLAFLVWAAIVGVSIGGGRRVTAWPEILSSLAWMFAAWSVVLGPQLVRYDFRHDLAAADLLKSYPMKGWQVALGEILAPAMILTAVQWILLTLIGVARVAGRGLGSTPPEHEQSALLAAFALVSLPVTSAIVAPMLNLLSLLIPNAAALLLPGWFAGPGAGSTARGIEVMGQRLIFILGQFFVLLVAVAPAALVFFVIEVLLTDPFLGPPWSLPVCALAASAVLAAEFCFGLAALGHWFERYDLSAEQLS